MITIIFFESKTVLKKCYDIFPNVFGLFIRLIFSAKLGFDNLNLRIIWLKSINPCISVLTIKLKLFDS